MRRIDLTHPLNSSVPVYPEDHEVRLIQETSLETYDSNVFSIETGLHVGTHMDGPLHMRKESPMLSQFPVDRFFGRGVLLDARGRREIGEDVLGGNVLERGDVVLLHTGWDKGFWRDGYMSGYPVITKDFARILAEVPIGMLGVDSPSPDNPPYEVHHVLFEADILILENLCCLEQLLDVPSFIVIALPLKTETDSSLVRVVAEIN